jgi:hypothetical protein
MKQIILATAALAALALTTIFPATSATAALQAEGTIQRGFDVGAGGTLQVNADFGSIEVTTSDANRVEVTVTREVRDRYRDDAQQILAELQVDVSQSGNDVIVRAEASEEARDRWRDEYRNTPVQMRFAIRVPRVYNVDLETAGGSIEVSDLEGEVRSSTAGGSLTFGNIAGAVRARTAGGNITLEGSSGTADVRTSGGSITIGAVEGTVDAETSGGSIRIDRAGADVTAHTSGGSIEVEEVRGAIDASTAGGTVRATITEQPSRDCRLSTSGGSVIVTLAAGIAVNVDASSGGGGSVSSDFEVDGRVRRTSIEGAINGGGPQLHLRTSGGSVRIRRR